jgi:hypothetical protein
VSGWAVLAAELDRWDALGRRATLWWRDDDACRNTPALQRLLAIAGGCRVPVAIAVIPAALEHSLTAAIAASHHAIVVQHGYAHRNHAPPGARNWELGAHRDPVQVVAELALGQERLAAAFGAGFVVAMVPPWNRIDGDVVRRLPAAGFLGLSTFGPRASSQAAPRLVQCNTHVDLIAWRKGGGFIGEAAAIERIVGHLQARRVGNVDAAEPTGVLSHHLDFGDDAWRFLEALFAHTQRHRAVDWIEAADAFAADAGGASFTCGRSA